MTTTAVKGYERKVNGTVQYVDGYNRGVGHGFTRDGRRITRAQAEFVMTLKRRAQRGDTKAQARLTKQGITY